MLLLGHLEKILVKPGDRVTRSQLIGLMGSTGTSTGTHLHYEIRKNNQAISPAPYLKNAVCAAPNNLLPGGTR